MAKLESDVSHIREDIAGVRFELTNMRTSIDRIRDQMREDFRVMAGLILGVALIVLGVLAKALGWF